MLVSYPFTLQNISTCDLCGITLDLSGCFPPVQHCTVVRQRGTLTYDHPFATIALGNFYPEESCTLILSVSQDMPPLDASQLMSYLSASVVADPTLTPVPVPYTDLSEYLSLTTPLLCTLLDASQAEASESPLE